VTLKIFSAFAAAVRCCAGISRKGGMWEFAFTITVSGAASFLPTNHQELSDELERLAFLGVRLI
jgi:hypothetical protein